jgi:bifunctional DNA-binding transcriptional regulator/antitoxin component of YhaV-PrlF toxin-antitoxin module
MTTIVNSETGVTVPAAVQRRAGIKAGDRVEFKVSGKTITITTVEPVYKPARAELTAITRGEAAIARGEHVFLDDFLHALDHHPRKAGTKAGGRHSRKRPG